MKPEKCQNLSSLISENGITVENELIASSKYVKLLRMKLDVKLNFDFYIRDICQKAG